VTSSSRNGVLKVAVAAGVFAILVPSIAAAGGGGGGGGGPQPVKVTNQPTVKIGNQPSTKVKDTAGGNVNSRSVPKYGRFGAPGSSGAIDTWDFKGAFLGYMDNLAGSPAPSTMTIPAAGGTAELHRLIVMESPNYPNAAPGSTTVNCEIMISTDAVTLPDGVTPAPLLEGVFTEPTVLESPLRLTDDFHIQVTGPNDGGDSNCAVGVVGYAPQSALTP
jgi:hypothetical protein